MMNKPETNFQIGNEVVLLDGPFKGFRGHIVDMNPYKNLAMVALDVFSRSIMVEITFNKIDAVT